jgi:hypothetical protein
VLPIDPLRLEARYRFDARAYSDPSRQHEIDFEHRVLATVHTHFTRFLDGDYSYSYLHVDTNQSIGDPARLDRHRGDFALTARPTRWLTLALDYGVGGQHLPLGVHAIGAPRPRDDVLIEVTLYAAARPLAWLELFARYDYYQSTSTDPAGAWHRNQVVAGVSLLYPLERTWKPHLADEPQVARGRVTFRFRGKARAVSVVGDWNGWDPSAQPLEPVAGGRFEAAYTLPPGRHEYALSVDGATVAPPDAPAYVPDGFGGKNGVLTVP